MDEGQRHPPHPGAGEKRHDLEELSLGGTQMLGYEPIRTPSQKAKACNRDDVLRLARCQPLVYGNELSCQA